MVATAGLTTEPTRVGATRRRANLFDERNQMGTSAQSSRSPAENLEIRLSAPNSQRGFAAEFCGNGLSGRAFRAISTTGNAACLKAIKETYLFPNAETHRRQSEEREYPTKTDGRDSMHSRGPGRLERPICGEATRGSKRFTAWKGKWWVNKERACGTSKRASITASTMYSFPREL